ncbi:MAG: protein kinase domain-containing protein [Planctomycetales bacterium]
MAVRVSPCNPDRLKQLLDEQLSDAEQVAVAEHLEDCDACRSALETLAAGHEWWDEASSLLNADLDTAEKWSVDTSSSVGDSEDADFIVSPLSTVESSVGNVPLDFLEPSDSPMMLGMLGDYDIIEPIGCGGMGVVLKGYDSKLNRFVAVKVLAPHYATSAAARKRFAREAKAAAAVVHPHVLAIHSVDSTGRLPFLVMPFVDGESLQERVRRNGQLGTKEVLRIGIQAARGLQAAHEQGLVHRDIKPGNILLERDVERAMLTDFGLARAVDDASMTRSGVIAGTPQFMSPEQARGEAVDHRSDLFSLGSVLYTMCAGRPPFRAETTMGLLRRIIDVDPRPLPEVNADIPVWLAAIVEKLHAKNADDRFDSAGELADLLEGCLAHVQQPTKTPLPDSIPQPVVEPKQTQSWKLVAGASLAIVVTVLVVTSQSLSEWLAPSVTPAETVVASGQGLASADANSAEATSPETTGAGAAEAASMMAADTSWESDIDQDIGLLSQRIDVLEEELPLETETGLSGQTETPLDAERSTQELR